MKQYICIDIGGTAIKYGVVQSGEIPEIIQTDSCKTPENGTKILQKVFDIIEGLKRNCGQTEAVCISSAGIVNSEEGCILEANDDLIPGYTGTKIADRVKEKFGIPCFVIFDGDRQNVGKGDEKSTIDKNHGILKMFGCADDFPDGTVHENYLGFEYRLEENLSIGDVGKAKALKLYIRTKEAITSADKVPAWVSEVIEKLKLLPNEAESVLLKED